MYIVLRKAWHQKNNIKTPNKTERLHTLYSKNRKKDQKMGKERKE